LFCDAKDLVLWLTKFSGLKKLNQGASNRKFWRRLTMDTQNQNWIKKFTGALAAVGATALIGLPVVAQFNYSASIFNPSGSTSRSVDGTVAGELDSAIKYYRDFQSFAEAMKTAGLTENFRAKDQTDPNKVLFTVFAPTDEAFAALPADIREKLFKPENKDKLAKVLNYHIVPGQVTAKEVEIGVVQTAAGMPVKLELNTAGDKLTLNGASVVQSSRRTANGVIVLVDKVLLPPDLF
jgi:uncharacterized surface protein with fasciclin (FAS1) repeats